MVVAGQREGGQALAGRRWRRQRLQPPGEREAQVADPATADEAGRSVARRWADVGEQRERILVLGGDPQRRRADQRPGPRPAPHKRERLGIVGDQKRLVTRRHAAGQRHAHGPYVLTAPGRARLYADVTRLEDGVARLQKAAA